MRRESGQSRRRAARAHRDRPAAMRLADQRGRATPPSASASIPNTLRFRMKKLGVVGPAGRARHQGAAADGHVGLTRRPLRGLAAGGRRRRRGGRPRRPPSRASTGCSPGVPTSVAPLPRTRCSASMPATSADTRSVRSISRATAFGAGREQFRDLRDTQPAGHAHDASIAFRDDADPAIHSSLLDQVVRHDEPARIAQPCATERARRCSRHGRSR